MNKIARFLINMMVVLVAGAAVSYGAFKSQYHPYETDKHSDIEIETITECENVPIYFVPDHDRYAKAETQPEVFSGYNFIPLSADVQAAMYTLCQKYEISYELVLAVAKAESGINPDAVSPDGGDFGLCQIHASIWDKVAANNGLYDYRTDPVQNVHMMLIIFTECMEYSGGKLDEALNYYNHGTPDEHIFQDGTSYTQRVYTAYDWVLDNISGNGCGQSE